MDQFLVKKIIIIFKCLWCHNHNDNKSLLSLAFTKEGYRQNKTDQTFLLLQGAFRETSLNYPHLLLRRILAND